MLRPVRARYAELTANQDHVRSVLATGAAKARSIAGPTLQRAMRANGLLAASPL